MSLTKEDLDTALTVLKDELRSEMRGMKDELHSEMRGMKDELRSEMRGMKDELRSEMRGIEDKVDTVLETARQIETNLLTEFHRYAKNQQIRLHSLETGGADLTLRLAGIEERLLALEFKPRGVPPSPTSPPQ